MPRNNLKAKRLLPATAATEPKIEVPNVIFKKTLQDALIDGLEDPAQFCMDFLDIEPYPKQQDFLRAMRDCSEVNFVAGNRVGKTWVGGATLCWKAFYRHISPYTEPDKITPHNIYKAVSTSMTIDQAKLAWTYAHTFATNSSRFRMFLEDTIYSPFPTMSLRVPDGKGGQVQSEIWARSLAKGGLYLLGHSINYILVDECAYIKNYQTIEDEVIRMRLADTGGSIGRFSTPNGRNHFYTYHTEALKGDPRFYSYRITTWDNPYVSKEFLNQQKERMLPEYYAQNILAEFVSLSDFFKIDHIQALYEGVDYDFPVEAFSKARYAMGVDLGAQRDPTVVTVFDISQDPWKTVLLAELKNSSWRSVREWVAALWRKYQPEHTCVDSTGVGAPVAQALIEEDGLTNVEPFVFSASSKPDLMVRLQDAVQRRRFLFPYTQATKDLVAQLSFYRLDDKNLTQDYVMSAALANLAAERLLKGNQFDTEIFEDLAVVAIKSGGREVPEEFIVDPDSYDVRMQGGLMFDIDPETGLYVPREWEEEDYPYGYF